LRRIAAVYASEGTGHRSAAEALRKTFLLERPDCEAVVLDVLDLIPAPLRAAVSQGYVMMARHAPSLWSWFYNGSDRESPAASAFDAVHHALCKRYLPKLEEELDKFAPDAVFFTHYFGAAPFARRNSDRFPVFYVSTDFLTHRFQRSAEFARSFVASREAAEQYERDGIEGAFISGIPIAPRFAARCDKRKSAEMAGLNPDKKTILVSGGGIGAGDVESAAESLAADESLQITVICGNNAGLFKRLSARYRDSSVKVMGFTREIELYYASADLAIMKPGGLSLSEVLAFGVPMLLMSPVPGQERLNLDCMQRAGAALELEDPSRALEEAKRVLSDEAILKEMSEGARRMAKPGAARAILQEAERFLLSERSDRNGFD
jgi:processive 1,2-diacylglycerol beta-glucosyltransferase